MLRYNAPILKRFARLEPKILAYNLFYEMHSGVITQTSRGKKQMLPNSVYVETGSSCGQRCRDCYVPVEDRKQDIRLSGKNLEGITLATKHIKVNYITILGGAPFGRFTAEANIGWMKSNPGMRFAVCTGGEGLGNANVMGDLKKLHNMTLVFSYDGFEGTNDRIRGAGSFAESNAALQEYSGNGKRLSGAIVTLRKDNIAEATSPDFLHALASKGCHYLEFGPYYTEKGKHSINPGEYADALLRLMGISQKIPAIIFSNHFGQLFGKRVNIGNRIQAVTIDYRGNVYTARRGKVFGNINEKPLLEIINSAALQELFKSKHRDYDADAVAETDARYPHLFKETVGILERAGVQIIR